MHRALRSQICTACVLSLVVSATLHAVAGNIVHTFPWSAEAFVQHPTRPIIYASLTDLNAVAIIDTNTLEFQTVPIGIYPTGMGISPDGSRLYVANFNGNTIGVLDTLTNTPLAPIPLSTSPRDVEVGLNNRLFVSVDHQILQINPTTGASAGPSIGGPGHFYDFLEITRDRRSLYYGGHSGGGLFKYDVSTSTPSLLWSVASGESGQDLALSHDESMINHANGFPYRFELYRTDDKSLLGTFETGPYPQDLAFSPDDRIAYTIHTNNTIDVYDTSTFQRLDSFFGSGPTSGGVELIVDAAGRYLFASSGNVAAPPAITTVFAIPEPSSILLVPLSLLMLLSRGRKLPSAQPNRQPT